MAFDQNYETATLARNLASLQAGQNTISIHTPSLRESLTQELSKAMAEVDRITELVKLIDKNPDTGRILELMGRRNY